MRFAEGTLDLAAGDAVQCPPGVAHQLANDGDSDFEYLVISSNPEFDTCYYPDSDKVSLNPTLEVDKGPLSDERDGLTVWTQVKEGLKGNYWGCISRLCKAGDHWLIRACACLSKTASRVPLYLAQRKASMWLLEASYHQAPERLRRT